MPVAEISRGSVKKLIALIVFVLFLMVGFWFLPVNTYVTRLLAWTHGLGSWGPVVVGAFYVPACVLMLPGSVLSLSAGLLFGVVTGTIAVSLGSTIGACVAFWVGRTIARDWVAQKVRGNARFAAVSDAVAREGFKIVLLTRLSPVFPFNLLNYAYGVTTVSFFKYAAASWIGMLPGTILYVYIGSTAGSLAALAAGNVQANSAQTALKWVGFTVTIVVTLYVTHVARKALREVNASGERMSNS